MAAYNETIGEALTLTTAQVVNARFNVLILEQMLLPATYELDSTLYFGWIMNLDSRYVSRYLNYDFNSVTKYQSYYLGANGKGIAVLDGENDDGDEIKAFIETGVMDFDTHTAKRVEKAWLGARSDGQLVLKTVTNEQIERLYLVRPLGMPGILRTSITLGKGVKSAYWQFKLENLKGADFDVDSIEFYVVPLTRI